MGLDLQWQTDGPTWPHNSASRFVVADGLRWHVQVMGQGPLLLLLHGTGASTHSWRGLMSLLAPRFTIIAPDLPGHGFTQRPSAEGLTLPGMATAIGGLLRALKMSPEFVVGHSAGAAVGLRATLDGMVDAKAIVSLNGALLPFQGMAGHIFKPLAKLFVMQPFLAQLFAWRAGESRAVERLLRGTGSVPSVEDVELYQRLFSSPRHVGATLAMMANWDLQPLLRDLVDLRAFVVLVTGGRDIAIPPSDADRAAMTIPHCRIEKLPDLGHMAHEERPDVVAQLIDRCLMEHAGAQQ